MAKDSDSSEDEMVYIIVKDESDDEGDKMALISNVSKNDTWIIDSGCSQHMNGDKEKFETMEPYDGGSVCNTPKLAHCHDTNSGLFFINYKVLFH